MPTFRPPWLCSYHLSHVPLIERFEYPIEREQIRLGDGAHHAALRRSGAGEHAAAGGIWHARDRRMDLQTYRDGIVRAKPEDLPPMTLDEALEYLGKCETFECVRRAHYAIDGRSRFNFPHYFLSGWQKCATTSVNANLRFHPQYLASLIKESHYFTVCKHSQISPNCKTHNESEYLRDFLRIEEAAAGRLEKVTVDASVDYAWVRDFDYAAGA